MDQNKTITIIDLKPKSGVKKDGTGTWTKYLIKGNDGIIYETWDQNWFLQRKIGETINVTFWTSTYQGQRGLRTTYNLVLTPPAPQQYAPSNVLPQPSRVNPGVNANVAALIAEIKRAEINIIAAIRVHCGNNLKGVERSTVEPPVLEENGQGGYAAKNDEEEEEISDDNPF